MKGDSIDVFNILYLNLYRNQIRKKVYADDPEPIYESEISFFSNTNEMNPSSFVFAKEEINKYEVTVNIYI